MAPPRPAPGRTALFLLGAPGSGAATLARVLEAAGAAAPADPAAVARFNDQRLADAEAGWTDPFGPRPREGDGVADEPTADDVAAARALLRTAEPHQPLLVLADPRHTRLATLWTAALEAEGLRCAFIILVRAPGEAAAALKAAEGVTRNRGLLLWTSYMLEAERVARGGPRVVTAYDRLAADPEGELDRIERGLGLRLPRRTWDSAAEIEALLREEPRAPAPSALPPGLAPLHDLHAHLQAAAQDEPENTDTAAETARWFASLADVMAPVLHQVRREAGGAPPGGREPAEDPKLAAEVDAARREAKEASARAEEAEARVEIVQAALTVARRRSAEAETLLQSRATEASAGERDARAALASVLAARDAAQAARDDAEAARAAFEAERDAALSQRDDALSGRDAALSRRDEALSQGEAALSQSEAALSQRDAALLERDDARDERDVLDALRRELEGGLQHADETQAELKLRLSRTQAAAAAAEAALEREVEGERARHRDARERLALTGLSNLAAQARVRELQSQIDEARADLERRRRWLPRLFGLR